MRDWQRDYHLLRDAHGNSTPANPAIRLLTVTPRFLSSDFDSFFLGEYNKSFSLATSTKNNNLLPPSFTARNCLSVLGDRSSVRQLRDDSFSGWALSPDLLMYDQWRAAHLDSKIGHSPLSIELCQFDDGGQIGFSLQQLRSNICTWMGLRESLLSLVLLWFCNWQ